MPSNYFQLSYYLENQKQGRPHIRLVHKKNPEINEDFIKWAKYILPYNSTLRKICHFIPLKGGEKYPVLWENMQD